MHALLRAAAIFGGVFVAFGPPYSWLLLRLLYGTRWTSTDAPTLLGAYCFHVCAMAINGVGEAFVYATASPAQLVRLSRGLLLLAALYLPLSALALRAAGTLGLVLTNLLNMGGRIAYACAALRTASTATDAAAALPMAPPRLWPHRRVLLALALSATLMHLVGAALGAPHERTFARHAAHVAVGGACLMGVGLTAWRAEPEILNAMRTARLEAKAARSD